MRQISYTTQNSMFKDETFSLVNYGTQDDADLVFTFKTRLMLELNCDMEYSNFPFDIQSCPVLLASMRELGTNKMSVKWKTLQLRWIKKQISNMVLKFKFITIALRAVDRPFSHKGSYIYYVITEGGSPQMIRD